MATIRTAIQITDGMSPAFRSMSNAMNVVLNTFEAIQAKSNNLINTSSIQTARTELAKVEVACNQVEQNIAQSTQQQNMFNNSMRNGQSAADGLLGKIKGFAGAYLGMRAAQSGIDMADTYANNNARLALINDNLQTQEELQNKIYQAAQRSRGSYTDMVGTVAKLGLLAGDAFKGNDETIRFVELMNKAFKASGAANQEKSAAMYQLTQAMSSGRLQGDEYRSISEGAPMLKKSIEDYMHNVMKVKGSLKEMSADGLLTADVVKNSLFRVADEIEAKFKTMPMTFADIWNQVSNVATKQFGGVMQKVSAFINSDVAIRMVNGILVAISNLSIVANTLLDFIVAISSFFVSNWGMIEPLIWGIVTAFLIYNGVLMANAIWTGITAAADLIAASIKAAKAGATLKSASAIAAETAAQWGLNAALLACPLTWIILLIIAIIIIIYAAVAALNKFAGTSISATGIIAGAFMVAVAYIGNLLISLINYSIDGFAVLWNYIAAFANFFANVFNDPVGAIARLFYDMVDVVLQLLQSLASAIDTIFGSNLAGSVQGWRDSLTGWVDQTYGKGIEVMATMNAQDMHLGRFDVGAAYDAGYNFGANMESKFNPKGLLGDFADNAQTASNIANIADNTGKMKDSMDATEEDLKYLRDLAEKEVINRFTTAEVKVEIGGITNNVNSDVDLDGIVNHITQGVSEAIDKAAEGVHG